MPNDRGQAKDFFKPGVANGAMNPERGLLQFTNGSGSLPAEEDLVVFDGWTLNPYGHAAIVSAVGKDFVELIQKNPGPFGACRIRLGLVMEQGQVRFDHPQLLGWLRRARDQGGRSGRSISQRTSESGNLRQDPVVAPHFFGGVRTIFTRQLIHLACPLLAPLFSPPRQ